MSKSNGKDMLDSFINIYVHIELVDWLYYYYYYYYYLAAMTYNQVHYFRINHLAG